jgi:hypothetical protein
MTDMEEGTTRAFSTFRVLNGDSNIVERDQLFRNMAQLYSYVSDRCDDEQVAQYDEVLCQLAELVESEARVHVAKLLAPLDRAPGNVVVKLANDEIEVAQPLLEFSNVLSDDDLIEIIANQSEDHRLAIAGRPQVPERVGEAIVEHGETASVIKLVRNAKAELGQQALERLAERAASDAAIAEDLRGHRGEIDWKSLNGKIEAVGDQVRETMSRIDPRVDPVTVGKVQAVVYNRMRNRAGFSSQEWKVAYNQVKALSDRKQLDERALVRFARFGYGHHTAAALTMLLRVGPEVFVKWLAMQDYVAITVALRALGIQPDLFEAMIASMPWRDLPSQADLQNVRRRFEALSKDEAAGIFELWRTHAFRRRLPNEDVVGAA